ncbi:HIR complex subunit [Lecanora helva]
MAAAESATRGESTSPGLSSPPTPGSPTRQTATPTSFNQSNATPYGLDGQSDANVGGEKSGKSINAKTSTPVARRKPRKKKDPDAATPVNNPSASTTPTVASNNVPEEKPRKRAPRGTSEAYKKRQAKIAEEKAAREREAEALEAARHAIPSATLPPSNYGVPAAMQTPHQKGNNDAIHTPHVNTQNLTPQTRPASGQNYDPIRSSTVALQPTSPMPPGSTTQKPYSQSSASASPSIYSIIDPPNHTYAFPPPTKREGDSMAPSPPELKRPRLSPPLSFPSQQSSNPAPRELAPAISEAPATNASTAIVIDAEMPSTVTNGTTSVPIKKPSPKESTAASSSSHSPKPSRPKDATVAMPSGSGLLSGTVFGGGYDNNAEKLAPTVVLNVPLTSDHQYVNFTRLAEERYGFNALHPRLAAQRERLARVAAAGAALENANKLGNQGSADDMSVDLSEGEADNSNVEMGGTNDSERNAGGRSGEETGEAGAVKKPRKRLMKEDFYDKEDDFIDDTELIWEEQAATSKDGFFVYSGPLIPPGQEPTVERTDGPAKRGRGGRGRGGTTRGSRGGGPGSRGGANAPGRKPRVTKAAKEQMEKEKAQRENLAVLASKPAGYAAPS